MNKQRIKLWSDLLLKWGDATIADSYLKEFDKRFAICKELTGDGVTIGTTPYFPNPHGISSNKIETPVTDKPYDFTCPHTNNKFYFGDKCWYFFVWENVISPDMGIISEHDRKQENLAYFHTSADAIAWSKARHDKEESKEELYYGFLAYDTIKDSNGLPQKFTERQAKNISLFVSNFYPVDYVNDMIKQGKRFSDFDTSKKLKV